MIEAIKGKKIKCPNMNGYMFFNDLRFIYVTPSGTQQEACGCLVNPTGYEIYEEPKKKEKYYQFTFRNKISKDVFITNVLYKNYEKFREFYPVQTFEILEMKLAGEY